MKLNRRPPETLADDVILRDREYWKGIVQRFIGWTADDASSLEEVCRVAEELHRGTPGKNFKGDREYLRHPMSANTWSKLRSTGGAVYALHEKNAKSASERRRMGREAQLAFKQAYTLNPKNPEAVWRYTMYLLNTAEPQQARTLVQSALKLDPENNRTQETAKYVEGYIRWSQGNR
jgi:tetratricopeptide (TPR) repeat protein